MKFLTRWRTPATTGRGIARHDLRKRWRLWLGKEGRGFLRIFNEHGETPKQQKTIDVAFTLTSEGLELEDPHAFTGHQAVKIQQILETFWVQKSDIFEAVLVSGHRRARVHITGIYRSETFNMNLTITPLHYPWIIDGDLHHCPLEFYNL